MMQSRFGYVGLAAVLAVAGCQQELPPRSFVQPNLIKKVDLVGTWYYIQTVADAPPTNGAMFIGQSSSLMKVRFDVQEDYLYARRAYEQVEGSEDQCVKDKADGKLCLGQPMAAWKIQSHFDIIRDYNPTTGEQGNKIIESTERPWYQREFIRVDWSQQAVTDYVGLGIDFFFSDGVKIQPVSYWQSNPTHPDALHMERATDSDRHAKEGFQPGEMFYLDITNQLVVTPEQLTACYEENGRTECFSYPRCFLAHEMDDCASQNVKVKHSFAKIGPKHDYEPRMWDGNQMQLFGIWDVGLRRIVYNRQYPNTLPATRRVAARFNIWEESCFDKLPQEEDYAKKLADAQTRGDGTAITKYTSLLAQVQHIHNPTVCNSTQVSLPASTISGWEYAPLDETGKTRLDARIPPAQRKIRTIPYYAEGSLAITYENDPDFPDGYTAFTYPEDLFDKFKKIVGSWNDAMKTAVLDATGSMAPQDVFVPCHSPVRPGDPEACRADLAPAIDADGNVINDKHGNPILFPRQGDPRRSTVFWVNQPQAAGPLGYGPPLFDDETGETISGQAYIYGAAIDSYTARSRDLVLLQNGDVDPVNFTNGDPIVDFFASKSSGITNGANASQWPTYTPQEVLYQAKSMNFDWAKAFSTKAGYPPIDTSSPKGILDSINARDNMIWTDHYQAMNPGIRTQRLQHLIGTPLERMMITPELMAAGAISPAKKWDDLNATERARVSPLRYQTIDAQADKDRMRFEQIGLDFATFDDPGLSQHLRKVQAQFCPQTNPQCQLTPFSNQIYDQLRQDIFFAVTLHEVGHNMGCRHNFRASYDAMNYFDSYWKLRTDAMQNPDTGMTPSDGKLHPRYLNIAGGKLSNYEANNSIIENQYSSIMDYGAEYNSDFLGLGLYDKALIKFSYAEYVEVFTDMKSDNDTLNKVGALHQFQSALGFPSPLGPGAGLSAIPYHTYPNFFNSGWQGIYKRADVPFSSIQSTAIGTGGSNSYKADDQGRALVPYYFCSDEYAGNLTCQRFDSGADPYEQAADIASRYRNLYLTNNFWRQKITFFTSAGYRGRIKDRYFDKLRAQLTWYVLLRGDFQGFLTDNAELGSGNAATVQADENKFFVDENGWGSFTVAVNLGFETIAQTLTQPNIGLHFKHTDMSGQQYWKQFNDDPQPNAGLPGNVRRVNYLDGRFINTTWDFNTCGYYWSDECQKRIGFLIDKVLALNTLSESQAYFTGRDTSVDVRQYAIGYIVPFKKQIEEKFGALLSSDLFSYAPTYHPCSPADVQSGRCDAAGSLIPRQRSWVAPDPNGAPSEDRIDPATGFTVQLYAGVYGLSSFPTTFDQEFIDTTKIFVVGNGEASVPDSVILATGTYDPAMLVTNGGTSEWFLYKDPQNGKTYAAHATPPRSQEILDTDRGVAAGGQYTSKSVPLKADQGARMLEHLALLASSLTAAKAMPDADVTKVQKVATAQSEFDQFQENIEVMRSLHNAFGYGNYRTDAPFYY